MLIQKEKKLILHHPDRTIVNIWFTFSYLFHVGILTTDSFDMYFINIIYILIYSTYIDMYVESVCLCVCVYMYTQMLHVPAHI